MREQDIKDAYQFLLETTDELYHAEEQLIEAQDRYIDARAKIILSIPPKELGANEEQRDAKINDMLAAEVKARRSAEAYQRCARHAHERARIGEQQIHSLLRFLSLGSDNPSVDFTTVATTPIDDGIPF